MIFHDPWVFLTLLALPLLIFLWRLLRRRAESYFRFSSGELIAGIRPTSLRTNCDIRLARSVDALSLKLNTSRGAPLSRVRRLAR